MKKLLPIIIIGILLTGCATMTVDEQEVTEFGIESMAMLIGYEMRESFEMTPDIEFYFDAIEKGQINLQGAQMAEQYLSTITHPVLANRFLKMASMVGFDLNEAGNVVGVEKVDIRYLQAAARGFRMGLTLQ
jgi:hypothetical protein